MPKKRYNNAFAKPPSTPHHTLLTRSNGSQNGLFQSASSGGTSVNDLISHLRQTQVSSPSSGDEASRGGSGNPPRFVAPRSVHPSLRNVLELPETPPPRSRPGVRRVGVGGLAGRRLRRTPGPPPPESWLNNNSNNENDPEADMGFGQGDGAAAMPERRVINRLNRLPGAIFPPENSLLHMALKAMAQRWTWHVAYDGPFLAMLPSHIKVLLLSYIAGCAKDQSLGSVMHGLKPVFGADATSEESEIETPHSENITRLDLGNALGQWISFRQLSNELFQAQKPASHKLREAVPSSWEDEFDEDDAATTAASDSVPQTLDHGSRFQSLQYLSLAHPNLAAANWRSLLTFLSHLSTLTHLSLAHWPVPTFTPNAVNARIRHPQNRSLTFSYGGTDTYSAMENNWAETAGILRKLSQVTYCLKWLDLEGCGEWYPALCWNGTRPDGEEYKPGTTGPEWNRSWRDIEYVRLGVGWVVNFDESEMLESVKSSFSMQQQSPSPSRSLAASIHATPQPPPSLSRIRGVDTVHDAASDNVSWDVEVERVKYRRSKEMQRYSEIAGLSRAVQEHVHLIRREGKGKWIHFDL